MTFNDIFKPRVNVICRTREESDEFLRWLDTFGVLWNSGTIASSSMDDFGIYGDRGMRYVFDYKTDGIVTRTKELRLYRGSVDSTLDGDVTIAFNDLDLSINEREAQTELIMELYI